LITEYEEDSRGEAIAVAIELRLGKPLLRGSWRAIWTVDNGEIRSTVYTLCQGFASKKFHRSPANLYGDISLILHCGLSANDRKTLLLTALYKIQRLQASQKSIKMKAEGSSPLRWIKSVKVSLKIQR